MSAPSHIGFTAQGHKRFPEADAQGFELRVKELERLL